MSKEKLNRVLKLLTESYPTRWPGFLFRSVQTVVAVWSMAVTMTHWHAPLRFFPNLILNENGRQGRALRQCSQRLDLPS